MMGSARKNSMPKLDKLKLEECFQVLGVQVWRLRNYEDEYYFIIYLFSFWASRYLLV